MLQIPLSRPHDQNCRETSNFFLIEHHHFQTQDIGTYGKKLQPHGPSVITTGPREPHHKTAHTARSKSQRQKGSIKENS
jgi:hypothetical protein